MAPSLKDALDRYLQTHQAVDLRSFVMDRRDGIEGTPKSWQSIVIDIAQVTDGIFEVSHETLRTWAMDWNEVAA